MVSISNYVGEHWPISPHSTAPIQAYVAEVFSRLVAVTLPIRLDELLPLHCAAAQPAERAA
jgi:hypothetical protein